MALSEKDLARLGPAARAQIQEELARRDRARKAHRLLARRRYYYTYSFDGKENE